MPLLTDDQKSQLADLYDEANASGDQASMRRIRQALSNDKFLQDSSPAADDSGGNPLLSGLRHAYESFGGRLVAAGNALRQMNSADPVQPETGAVLDQSKQRAAVQQDVDSHAELDKPLMATTGGKVGAAAADAIPFALAPEGYAGAAGAGALEGMLTPTQGDQSRGINTVLGAAGGAGAQLAGGLVGRIIRPVGNQLVGARDAAVDVLRRAGVPLDAAQMTGSKILVTAKNAASDSPLLNASPMAQQQRQQFTRAALEQMGVPGATEADQETMLAGRTAIKNTYDAIASRTMVKLDPNDYQDPLASALRQIRASATNNLTPENRSVILNQIRGIFEAVGGEGKQAGGAITGTRWQNITENLDKVAGDGGKAPYVADIREALQAALSRNASPADQALMAKTDQQYGAMKQIERAIGPDNQVSPKLLFNAMDTARRTNQSVYGLGKNQNLYDLAQSGSLLIPNGTPNSGTTQRLIGKALFGGAGYGLEARREGKATGYGPSIAAAAAAFGGPALVRAAIENPAIANYVRNRAATSEGAAKIAAYAARAGVAGPAQTSITASQSPAQ